MRLQKKRDKFLGTKDINQMFDNQSNKTIWKKNDKENEIEQMDKNQQNVSPCPKMIKAWILKPNNKFIQLANSYLQ